MTLQVQLHVVFPERGGLHHPFELYFYDQFKNFSIPSPALLRSNQTFHWNTDWMLLLTGCKENHFYSLPFGQAEASIWQGELISQFFLNSNCSKNTTWPLGKLKTEFTSPTAKSTSPWPLDTTFFACCLMWKFLERCFCFQPVIAVFDQLVFHHSVFKHGEWQCFR